MDGFGMAKKLDGRGETDKDLFVAHIKPANELISLKRAKRLGRYLYLTEKNQLVSLAISKSKPEEKIARGMIEANDLIIYLFMDTN